MLYEVSLEELVEVYHEKDLRDPVSKVCYYQ